MTEDELSRIIIGAAIEVHREFGGPGLLEDISEEALCHELSLRNIGVRRQVEVPVIYKQRRLRKKLLLDLLVEDKVIVENKATEKYHSIYKVQLLTYLRLTGKKLGLVINYGEKYLKDGVHRVVNGL